MQVKDIFKENQQMDIHILQSVLAPMCLHLMFIFKKILEEDVFMYVWKKSCVDKAERKHMLSRSYT